MQRSQMVFSKLMMTLLPLGMLFAAGCAQSTGGSQAQDTSSKGSAIYKEISVTSGQMKDCPIGNSEITCRYEDGNDVNAIKVSLKKTKNKPPVLHFGKSKYIADGQVQILKLPNGVEVEYGVECQAKTLLLSVKSPNSPNAIRVKISKVSRGRYAADLVGASPAGDMNSQLICR